MKISVSTLKRIFKRLPPVRLPATLRVALVLTALAAVPAEASRACVFSEADVANICPVTSVSRSFELLGMGEETIIFVETSKALGGIEKASIVVSSRLEEGVLAGELDEEDAVSIGREIHELSGARYSLPSTREEVLTVMGFPESVEIADEDWGEMLRVHAERVLSLSAEASEFLLEQLGVESVAPVESAVPAGTTEESTPALDPIVVEADGNTLTTNAGL